MSSNLLTVHRFLLLSTGLMLVLIGFAYCLDPNLLLSRYDINVLGTSEDNMFRGAYGGLFITLGAAIACGFWWRNYRLMATVLGLLFMGGFALGRLASLALAGIPHEQILGLFVFEVMATVMFAGLLVIDRRSFQTVPTQA